MANTQHSDIALNTLDILNKYGNTEENNFIEIGNLINKNEISLGIKPSLYYDLDGMKSYLKLHKNEINILSLNIQSINSKFSELCCILQSLKNDSCFFDIICVQETWLNQLDNYNLFNIEGYSMYKKI